MKLHELDHLPPELLAVTPEQLINVLPGPSLIRIPGRDGAPLFVSILLHGNETSGLSAIQEYLQSAIEQHTLLPRTLYLFVGNVAAAAQGLRMLHDQPDYNRIWSGGERPEHRMASTVLARLRELQPFAAIDIHNNTGRNPFYGCVNRIEPEFLHLAGMFSPVTVYFTEPHEVISNACAAICPAVTLECGLAGESSGIGQIVHFLHQVMQLEHLQRPGGISGITEVYHTVAKMVVPEGARITFDPEISGADCCFVQGLDKHNFQDMPAGVVLANQKNRDFRIQVIDNHGRECSDLYLEQGDNRIVTRRSTVMAMLTPDPLVIQQDCFGYIMEHYPLPDADSLQTE